MTAKVLGISSDCFGITPMETKKVLWISALRGAVVEGPGPLASPLASPPACWTAEFRSPEDGIEALRHNTYDAVVLDFPIPEWSPAEVLEQVRRLAPGTLVFIRDPEATLSDAVRLAHLGAYQFLEAATQSADRVSARIVRIVAELKICMFCIGARTIGDLKQAKLLRRSGI